ncbi:coiled-coil domain containing 169 [Trichomycterus rosablanca]|uniref:coiled-coil domain containing 169 n=1 Tax=Trichomycterus rosablanca TaxID=2290929 RepID=UPI002F3529C3
MLLSPLPRVTVTVRALHFSVRLKMGDSDINNYDISRLQTELEQKKEIRDMLKDSVSDLRNTLADLQERLNNVDGEGNEWRTRYETQLELNVQLKKQIGFVQERLEGLQGNPMDRLASIRSFDEMSVETLRDRLKLLSTEKRSLESQLLECRLRTDQEGKAYQKAYDERRSYLSEIAKVSSGLDYSRKQHLAPKPAQGKGNPGKRSPGTVKAKKGQSTTSPLTRLPRLKR